MRRKLAEGIVRCRILILIIMLAAAGASAAMIGRTRINYDLTRYLSGDTMTKKALAVMKEEFGSSEQVQLMFVNRDDAGLEGIVKTLEELPEVRFAVRNPETDVRETDGTVYQLVTLTLNECDAGRLVISLREMFPEAGTYYVGGAASAQLDVQNRIAREMPMVMLISVGIVLAVLLLTSHAWLEPAVILPVLGISILINMGTNFIFADVSFITFAVSAILQLALSIDYAIMLLHAWNDGCERGLTAKEAMTEAVAGCLMRITSSAMTTVAGLMSLLFMSFTIGFDIGMVLSKGILISLLSVFLLMPALTLLMEKPLRATGHKPLRLGGEHLAAGIGKIKTPLAAVLILAVLCGAWMNQKNTYSFSDRGQTGTSEASKVSEVFGQSDPIVLLVPGGEEDADYDRQRELAGKLQALKKQNGEPALKSITAMVTTGEAALKYYTPADVAEMTGLNTLIISAFYQLNGFGESVRGDRLLDTASALSGVSEKLDEMQKMLSSARDAFIGPHYSRMLLDPNFTALDTDPDFKRIMTEILELSGEVYGENYYITGKAMSNYDISRAFTGDLTKVNIITLLAILLIVIISFRAVLMPLLLVFVIEGAIWITMGISFLRGESIFFMAYLICLAIQMGATIDYGILLCDHYRTLRLNGLEKQKAMGETLSRSMPTVLTSGTILTTAGFVIGIQCSVYYISTIGSLIARGALISVILVLTLLPALLLLCDRLIIKNPAAEGR